MDAPRAWRERLRDLIEAIDLPLVILAFLGQALYLTYLSGAIEPIAGPARALVRLIDVAFLLDLCLKLAIFGRVYVGQPWFLIDLMSSLPALSLISDELTPFGIVGLSPGLRTLRVFRAARIVNVLRGLPGIEALLTEPTVVSRPIRSFHRNLTICLGLLTVVLLGIVGAIRYGAEKRFADEMHATLGTLDSTDQLAAMGGSLRPVGEDPLRLEAVMDGEPRAVWFPRRVVERRADEVEFYFGVGMLMMLITFGYLMGAHQHALAQSQVRALLNLALPGQVADHFLVDPSAYQRRVSMPATVVFLDFVGFTRTCERMADEPDRLSRLLETSLDRVVAVMARHDVILDKFIGDAVMGFRGGPFVDGGVEEHAYRVVRCSLECVQALEQLEDPTFRRVKIGGASAENCLIGAFGTSSRLSYTILGDGVNLAARLEPASEVCQTSNLFCERTRRLCGERPDLIWRRWGSILVAGKSQPIMVFEAFDTAVVLDREFLASFHRGLEAFERRNFFEARAEFLRADAQRQGGDRPSRAYSGRCEELLADGTPPGWEPVLIVRK